MQARRGADLPAGVWAGIMASSRGSEIVTPIPRSMVRREICFFVINISCVSCEPLLILSALLHGSHLKLRTRDNALNKRREMIAGLRGVFHDCSNLRHIVILHAAAQPVNHQTSL